MYLMIENKGVAPQEAYTLLGASTARGEDASIGQFGTGAKHAILVLLRHKIQNAIYLGTKRLEFGTREINFNRRSMHQVTVRYDRSKSPTDLGFVLDLGAIDWQTIDLGLREFVSNALDQRTTMLDVNVTLVGKPSGREGYTRVFVQATPEVLDFYTKLNKWFCTSQAKGWSRQSLIGQGGT